MAYRETSLEERKRAARLYKMIPSSREVAEIVGCSPQSVLRWAELYGDGKRAPAEGRKESAWSREKQRKARDLGYMYAEMENPSTRAVAEATGLNRRTVMKYLRSEYNPRAYPKD